MHTLNRDPASDTKTRADVHERTAAEAPPKHPPAAGKECGAEVEMVSGIDAPQGTEDVGAGTELETSTSPREARQGTHCDPDEHIVDGHDGLPKATKMYAARDPKAGLPAGVSSRARGAEKLRKVLSLLYRFHVTTPRLVQELLNTKEAGYLREMERKGLVRAVPVPTIMGGFVFMLTPHGVLAAAAGEGVERPYPTSISSIPSANLVHDLAVQRESIAAMNRGVEDVIPARLLTPDLHGKLPDALWRRDGMVAAIEVELSGKFGGPLERAMGAHLDAQDAGKWSGTIYFSTNEELLRRYRNMLERPIKAWWYSQNSRQWFREDHEEKAFVKGKHRFEFEHRPALLKGLTHL